MYLRGFSLAEVTYTPVPTTHFSLNVTVDGGTFTKSPDKPYYVAGDTVIVTATPDKGNVFRYWEDDPFAPPVRYITFTDHDVNLHGVCLNDKTYTLDVTTDSGTVSIFPLKKAYYSGDEVTLMVRPATDRMFRNWDDGNRENPRKIKFGNSDIHLHAICSVQIYDHIEIIPTSFDPLTEMPKLKVEYDSNIPTDPIPDLEYSKDLGQNWSKFDRINNEEIIPSLGLWVRGVGNSSLLKTHFKVTGCKWRLQGDVVTLLDSDPTTIKPEPYTYYGLFSGNEGLTTVADLVGNPTYLPDNACASMFAYCTNLEVGPRMPSVTTLGVAACSKMFFACTKLIIPADLSGLEYVGVSGCENMYQGCTSLESFDNYTNITYVEAHAFSNTFHNCTKLKEPPTMNKLISIGEMGCMAMFDNCTSLINPANMDSLESVGRQGCDGMYGHCESLQEAPRLHAVSKVAPYAFDGMFYCCYKLVNVPIMNNLREIPEYACQRMFLNCTSLRVAPDFSLVEKVDKRGFYRMFEGCTSLVDGPILNATTVGEEAGLEMFKGCTSMKTLTATVLDWDEGHKLNKLKDWMLNVSPTGTFYGNGRTVAPKSRNSSTIPEGWSMVDMRADGCVMFAGDEIEGVPTQDTHVLHIFCSEGSAEVPNLEYAYSPSGPWTKMERTTNIPFGKSHPAYLRGTGNTTMNHHTFAVTMFNDYPDALYHASGDLRNLLDYKRPPVVLADSAFAGLFKDNRLLEYILATSASDFTECGQSTFYGMFENCENLLFAPALESMTNIGKKGCMRMFKDCKKLTTPVNLYGVTIAGESAFEEMYSGCSSLESIVSNPQLKEVGDKAFKYMFYDCFNLRHAADLNYVESLPFECFLGTYQNCVALEFPPQFKGLKHVGPHTFDSTFKGCTHLVVAPGAENVETLSEYSCVNMFAQCSALEQTPAMLKITEVPAYACERMFADCTSLRVAADLSHVKKLGEHAYDSMFIGCTSLQVSPYLDATELGAACGAHMFEDCTSLCEVHCSNPTWGDPTSVNSPTYMWLQNVSPKGVYYGRWRSVIPETRGASTIPEGWDIQEIPTEVHFTARCICEDENDTTHVVVTPQKDTYQPGETVTIDIQGHNTERFIATSWNNGDEQASERLMFTYTIGKTDEDMYFYSLRKIDLEKLSSSNVLTAPNDTVVFDHTHHVYLFGIDLPGSDPDWVAAYRLMEDSDLEAACPVIEYRDDPVAYFSYAYLYTQTYPYFQDYSRDKYFTNFVLTTYYQKGYAQMTTGDKFINSQIQTWECKGPSRPTQDKE